MKAAVTGSLVIALMIRPKQDNTSVTEQRYVVTALPFLNEPQSVTDMLLALYPS
jgi:hypothetical protein